MPYIKKEQRSYFDQSIAAIVDALVSSECSPGDVNYVVSRIVAGAMKPEDGWTYHSLSHAVSVLRDAATEMERRLMGPYEKKAISRNGDIPEYKEFDK
jgi:hypothetical protein